MASTLKRIDDAYDEINAKFTFKTFLGVPMMFDHKKNRYVHLTETLLTKVLHKHSSLEPRVSTSEAKGVFSLINSLSEDLDGNKHLILFGDHFASQKVWNMKTAAWEKVPADVSHIVWRSSTPPSSDEADVALARKFLLEVSQGDERHMEDILQACAPLFTSTKPLGVIWFSGHGRNGKSGVVRLLHMLLGDYLTKITLHQIQDGRLTPALNGHLGNVLEESSEGYIDDSEKYKVIGEHGTFLVRKFHSQESLVVDTSMLHTIFNTNNIPNFADKSSGVRARTIVIPFLATFKEDPSFFDRTFTPELLRGFLHLVTEAAQKLRDNGYVYDWGPKTLRAKLGYDAEVNTAEAYAKYLKEKSVTGFTNWRTLKNSYENWCGDNGEIPLGAKSLKRTMIQVADAESITLRNGDVVSRRWVVFKPDAAAVRRSELLEGVGLWVDPDIGERIKNEFSQVGLDIEGLA